MKKKGIWKKLLSVLFALGMAIIFLPGMRVTVKADVLTASKLNINDDWESKTDETINDAIPDFKECEKADAEELAKKLSQTGSGALIYKLGNEVCYSLVYDEGGVSNFRVVNTKLTFYNFNKSFGPVYYTSSSSEPTPSSDTSSEPAPAPKQEQDQTLITGYIVNGKDANGNDTYATFSQENVWSVTKVTSNANSVTYDIKPQWETYGTVHVGIPALGFSDGAVLVDHYKNGKLIATYNGWVTWEWCEFDNPDGFSTFVIRKPGTTAQTTKRAYVPNTGVK